MGGAPSAMGMGAGPMGGAFGPAGGLNGGGFLQMGLGGGDLLTGSDFAMNRESRGGILAIDMNRGEILWQIPHGRTPDHIRNHPALAGLDIGPTGQPGRSVGTLVTSTLLIAGEGSSTITETGVRGAMLRAYDKATGTEVGAVYLPATQSGSPLTYMLDGEQYIVLAVSGSNYSGELLAFKLN